MGHVNTDRMGHINTDDYDIFFKNVFINLQSRMTETKREKELSIY